MMEKQKPSVGRIVIYRGGPDDGFGQPDYIPWNGAEVAPAIITRVWGDECVNLTIFPDCGDPLVRTSRLLGDGEGQWSWPPRVS